MLPIGQPFTTIKLPSSKGGVVDLQEVFPLGTTVVGVIPRSGSEQWIEAASRHIDHWLLQEYVNVYLITDAGREEAVHLCERYGILAAFLLDEAGALYPQGEGFYRVDAAGVIEAAVGVDEGPHQLGRLFEEG